MIRRGSFLLGAVAWLAAAPLSADDVSGAERLICAPMTVHECRSEGDCFGGAPWEFDLSPFFEIDLKNRRVATTDGRRATALKDVARDGELIIVHAYETGRAFSAVISGPSGFLTATITLDDGVLTIFGACKPYGAER